MKSRFVERENAVLVAHYYVDPLIQDLGIGNGRMRGRFAGDGAFRCGTRSRYIVVAGVRFMGESAKILCPEKNGADA